MRLPAGWGTTRRERRGPTAADPDATAVLDVAGLAAAGPVPLRPTSREDPGDLVFAAVARASGAVVLGIAGLVGLFLTFRAWQALSVAGWGFLTVQTWEPDSHNFGIAAILFGTALIGLTAVAIALPFATATALYICEYAPPSLRRTLIGVVDLMAAVPSVVYGLWGAFFLQGNLVGVARWLSTYLGWIPLFAVENADPNDPLASESVYTSSTFVAGVVVAMMITPIMSSVMRETFSRAPVGEREGALALGATTWGMIRSVVLPFGRGGMIGGTMLGLGRALGETIAVFMIISPVFRIQPHILQNGSISVSALIALRRGEASPFALSALFAAGLALFIATLLVNVIASAVAARGRSGADSEG